MSTITSNASMYCGTASSMRREGNSYFAGPYKIDISQDTVTVTDTRTGKTVKVWGDPHVVTGDGDRGEFHKGNMTLDLAEGVKITIKPTPEANGTAYVDQVAIMQGDKGTIVSGVHTGNVNFGSVLSNSAAVDNTMEDGSVLRLADPNNLENLVFADTGLEFNGTNNGAEISLDGHRGTSRYNYGANIYNEQAANNYFGPGSIGGNAGATGGNYVPVDQRPEYSGLFSSLHSAQGTVAQLQNQLKNETDPEKRKEILMQLQDAKQEVSFILNMITNMLKQEQEDKLAIVRNLRSN